MNQDVESIDRVINLLIEQAELWLADLKTEQAKEGLSRGILLLDVVKVLTTLAQYKL